MSTNTSTTSGRPFDWRIDTVEGLRAMRSAHQETHRDLDRRRMVRARLDSRASRFDSGAFAVARIDAPASATRSTIVAGVDDARRTIPILVLGPDRPPMREKGRPLAITRYNLDAFRKDPRVFLSHDESTGPIGRAEHIEQTPDGVRMVVRFDTHARAEEAWRDARAGRLAAVSVRGAHNGKGVWFLKHVAFVPPGAEPSDPKAGTAIVNPKAAVRRFDAGDLERHRARWGLPDMTQDELDVLRRAHAAAGTSLADVTPERARAAVAEVRRLRSGGAPRNRRAAVPQTRARTDTTERLDSSASAVRRARNARDAAMANAYRQRHDDDGTPAAGNVGPARAVSAVERARAQRDQAYAGAAAPRR